MKHYECKNLFGAGRSLLESSRLVRYTGDVFVPNDDEDGLEKYWQESFDPDFGRYMAWVWFSVGAENLVKAALVCNGLLAGEEQTLGYSIYSRDTSTASWIDEVLRSRTSPKGGYGMLGDIWRDKLDELAACRGIGAIENNTLKAAYKYLTQAIRNRDAHSYIENQRRKDFPAVEGLFVPAFNTLVQAMKGRGHFMSNDDE